MSESNENLKEIAHHKQQELCRTRPPYRQGRNLTAVKVYTISDESQHLFIYGVPKLNLRSELKNQCAKYGKLIKIHVITDHKTEVFTECYHVLYDRIQSARIAKRFIDNRSFFGGILHVCYAPEFEDIEQTRTKLLQRNHEVLQRLKPGFPHHRKRVIRSEDEETVSSSFSEKDTESEQVKESTSVNNVQLAVQPEPSVIKPPPPKKKRIIFHRKDDT